MLVLLDRVLVRRAWLSCVVLASGIDRELEVTIVYHGNTRNGKAWFGVSRPARQKFLMHDCNLY